MNQQGMDSQVSAAVGAYIALKREKERVWRHEIALHAQVGRLTMEQFEQYADATVANDMRDA